jgi:hypothetical protein
MKGRTKGNEEKGERIEGQDKLWGRTKRRTVIIQGQKTNIMAERTYTRRQRLKRVICSLLIFSVDLAETVKPSIL